MALELVVGPGQWLDPEVLRNAAAAVLHYFKAELGRTSVSVAEFSTALRAALSKLGFKVTDPATTPAGPSPAPLAAPAGMPVDAPPTAAREEEADLDTLQQASGDAGELHFFQSLRADLTRRLQHMPSVIVYRGLRRCAQRLCASRRWTHRCQTTSDQIVDYLRACLQRAGAGGRCVLCVL
jgi:hypothetical protein